MEKASTIENNNRIALLVLTEEEGKKENHDHLQFLEKCWKKFTGLNLEIIVVMRAEDKDKYNPFPASKNNITLVKALENIPLQFQASVIRLLWPSLISSVNPDVVCVVCRADTIPCNKDFFYLKPNEVYENLPEKLPIFVGPLSTSPPLIVTSIEDIQICIKNFYLEFREVESENKLFSLLPTVYPYNRLSSINIYNKEKCKQDIDKGVYTDFSIPLPYGNYKQLLDEIFFLDFYINRIYILHYSKLIDRKSFMEEQLKKEKIYPQYDIVWVDNYDREDLTEDIIRNNYVYNPIICNRKLTMGEIANGIAHSHILRDIKGICMVVEDDIIFCNNFLDILYNNISGIKFGAIGLGGYVDGGKFDIGQRPLERSDIPRWGLSASDNDIISPVLIRPKENHIQTGCFLISENFIKKFILPHPIFKPFSAPIDLTLKIILKEAVGNNVGNNNDIFAFLPLIAYEGSKTSLFSTSFTDRGF